ncbi:MAG: PH domain-containing protein [Planctomycetota bacterium]
MQNLQGDYVPADLLLDGESVIEVIRPVWTGHLGSLGLIVFLAPVFLWPLVVFFATGQAWSFWTAVPMASVHLLLSALLVYSALASVSGQRYVLTNRRIIAVFDFITKRESMLYFDRIQNVGVHQGVLDSPFSTGTISIQTASGGNEPEVKLHAIQNPANVREKLMNLIEAQRASNDPESAPRGKPHSQSQVEESDVFLQMLKELRLIRKSLESHE